MIIRFYMNRSLDMAIQKLYSDVQKVYGALWQVPVKFKRTKGVEIWQKSILFIYPMVPNDDNIIYIP